MIDLNDLKISDVGRKVIYTNAPVSDEGELTSWNDKYVFVRFRGPEGEACKPEDVMFANE